MARLEAIADKPREAFDADPFLRDVAERNLEIIAQSCIDICQRIISLEGGRKPSDYSDAILIQAEIGTLPADFARKLAPIAGFRNILVHNYMSVDWDVVYGYLHRLEDIESFREHIVKWLKERT